MRYVLDCSVAIKWFVPEALSDIALTLLHHLEAGDLALIAPDSIAAELGYALRKLVLRNEINLERSQAIVEGFVELPLVTVPVRPLLPEAMRLTGEHMANFYDALYVALALRENLKVLTADAALTRAFAKLDRMLFLADFTPS